ncbi:MAG: MFS transporter [Asticcacaulis sp.]
MPLLPEPLSNPRLLAYASGNFGKNLLWGTVDITLMYLLTEQLGLSAALAGGLIFASLILDAVLYPWIGRLADQLRSPLGRYGPLILFGTLVAVASFVALFAMTHLNAPVALIALSLALFRLGYACLDLSHNALLTQISAAVTDNGRVAILRFLFSSLATLALAAVLPGLVREASPDSPLQEAPLTALTILLPLIGGGTILLAWLAVRAWDRHAHQQSPPKQAAFLAGLKAPNTVLILTVGAVAALFLPLFNKASLYFATQWLGEAQSASWLLGAMVAGQIFSLPLWLYLSPRGSKARSMQWAHALSALGFLLGVLGTLTTGPNLAWLMLSSAIAGSGLSGIYALIWALISDAAAELEIQHSLPLSGQLFAWAIFSQKLAMGLGAGLFGLAMSASGYERTPILQISRDTILGFSFVLPALGSLICMAILEAIMRRSHKTP